MVLATKVSDESRRRIPGGESSGCDVYGLLEEGRAQQKASWPAAVIGPNHAGSAKAIRTAGTVRAHLFSRRSCLYMHAAKSLYVKLRCFVCVCMQWFCNVTGLVLFGLVIKVHCNPWIGSTEQLFYLVISVIMCLAFPAMGYALSRDWDPIEETTSKTPQFYYIYNASCCSF